MTPTSNGLAAPVVKWCGGKTKLLPELLARLPPRWGRYYEPFAGGAALFFRLAPERAVLGDLNGDLMTMYGALAADVGPVIRNLRRHQGAHTARHYYGTRDRWNSRRSSWVPATSASAFIYMNKTCFNGLWRVNRSGDFNVPMGRYEDPTIRAPEALRAAHMLLARTDLRVGDYRKTTEDSEAGDLVYFDPPYDPASTTASFTGYTALAFGRQEQRELADRARGLVARGCHVVLSNSDTPFIRGLYKGFQIDRVQCSRSINSAGALRGDVDELIIVGRVRGRRRSNRA